MGIIHKKRKNIQNYLLLGRIWCIVTMRLCYRSVFVRLRTMPLHTNANIFNDRVCTAMNRESFGFLQQYRSYALFSLIYLLGLIAGLIYIVRYPYSSMMRLLAYPQMSIVIGFLISAIPFIVFYIFFRCSAFRFLLPLAFIKAFTFMYCFAGVSIAYADAGWLVRFLLLFTDFFSVPLFLWYAGRKFLNRIVRSDLDIWFCFAVILAVRYVDSYVISPFAMELLRF